MKVYIRNVKVTKSLVRKIERLHEEGLGWDEVDEVLGFLRSTCWRIMNDRRIKAVRFAMEVR